MSHLAVSDSTAECPEQSAPCPGHTFEKTAAIDAIVAKVPDNAFCHCLPFVETGGPISEKRFPASGPKADQTGEVSTSR
jgi:hypothetical protein